MSPHTMTETPRHSVSVAAAIFDESGESVLLIKRRDNGHWEPPGGVLELGETIEDGLRREVREETGTEIEVEALTGIYKNMSRGIIALVFRCRAATAPVPTTAEATSIDWWPLRDLPVEPVYRVRITDAHKGQSTVIRHHDGVTLLPESDEPHA